MIHKTVILCLFVAVFFSCKETDTENNQQEEKTIKSTLVDKNATTATIDLYERLKESSKKGIIYGHQDDLAYGIGWWNEEGRSDVKDVCGNYPGVFGWELGDIGNERSLDSVKFTNIQNWIIKTHAMGGINTVSWHIINPVTKGNSWDKTKAVHTILPGGENHGFYKGHLQKFATFNKALVDKAGNAIPIVFRPLHEHNGSWFWWGKEHCTKEEYTALWKFSVEYLRDSLKLNNLIYAYSPDGQFDDYLDRYPGDEFVDILGVDYYFRGELNKESIDKFTSVLVKLTETAKTKNKVAILSETGYETLPDPEWHTKAILNPIKQNKDKIELAYMLTWRNARKDHHYAPYKGHLSEEDFKVFHADSTTFFLNETE